MIITSLIDYINDIKLAFIIYLIIIIYLINTYYIQLYYMKILKKIKYKDNVF